MTTTQDSPTPFLTPYVRATNPEPVTLRRVLGSEWVKLRSLRPTSPTAIPRPAIRGRADLPTKASNRSLPSGTTSFLRR